MSEEIPQLISHLAAGVAGGLIGVFAAHLLNKDRERHRDRQTAHRSSESAKGERRRVFRSFMVQLRSEATDRFHEPGTFATFYQNKKPNLRHAASLIAEDFTDARRAEFDRLVSQAAGFTGEQADKGQKEIVESFDTIIRFMDVEPADAPNERPA